MFSHFSASACPHRRPAVFFPHKAIVLLPDHPQHIFRTLLKTSLKSFHRIWKYNPEAAYFFCIHQKIPGLSGIPFPVRNKKSASVLPFCHHRQHLSRRLIRGKRIASSKIIDTAGQRSRRFHMLHDLHGPGNSPVIINRKRQWSVMYQRLQQISQKIAVAL